MRNEKRNVESNQRMGSRLDIACSRISTIVNSSIERKGGESITLLVQYGKSYPINCV